MNKKAYAIDAGNIYELEDKINRFGQDYFIVATQIFPTAMGYDCLIWFNCREPENIMDNQPKVKFEPLTEKQAKLLKKLDYKGDIEKLSKKEANVLISEMLPKAKSA